MALSAGNALVFSCLVIFSISCFLVLGDTSCEPAEEGTSHNITIDFNVTDFDRFEYIGRVDWFLVRNNRRDRAAYCRLRDYGRRDSGLPDYFRHYCSEYVPGIEATLSANASQLTFYNVSRSEIPAMETTWMFQLFDGFDYQRVNVCDPLEVYAKPVNPTCDPPLLHVSTNQISLTCATEKVYPPAGCQFFYSKDNVHFQDLQGTITYSHTATKEDVVYYKSQCMFSAPADILDTEDNYFKVNMYPKLKKSQEHFYAQSNIVQIIPGFNTSDSSKAVEGDDNKDWTMIIALGVVLAVVAVAAVLFAIMWLRFRSKLKSQQAVRATQADVVPAPVTPVGYTKPEFVNRMLTDDGYEKSTTPARAERPKVSEEAYYEDVASEADGARKESVYANSA